MATIFTITSSTNHVLIDAGRQGSVTYTITNLSGRAVPGRASLETEPEDGGHAAWLSLPKGAEVDLPIAGTAQAPVQIVVPPQAPPGNYNFRLDMRDDTNPDETFTQGPSVTIAVPVPEKPKPKFPMWVIPLILGVLVFLAIVAVVIYLLIPKSVAVPRVAGLPVSTAVAAVTKVGLAPRPTYQENGTPQDIVIDSKPPAGTRLPKGENVDLLVSGGLSPSPTPTPTRTGTPPPSPTVTLTPTATPQPDYALQFNGGNDFVSIKNGGGLNLGTTFTIEAWVKPLSLAPGGGGGYKAIVRGAAGAPPANTGGSFVLFLDRNDYSAWGLSVCTPGCQAAASGPGNLKENAWQFLAATYDGSNINIYMDGKPVGSTAQTGSLPPYSFLVIGLWETSFNGLIDDVRVWNVARSESEIKVDRNFSPEGNIPGLVGHWRFNEGSGGTAADSTSNNNDGKLSSSGDPAWVLAKKPPFIRIVPRGTLLPKLLTTP